MDSSSGMIARHMYMGGGTLYLIKVDEANVDIYL